MPNANEVGTVPEETVHAIRTLQARNGEILAEIGRMEIRKAALILEARRLENQAQTLLTAERDRLGIPEGTPWQINGDGKAIAALE